MDQAETALRAITEMTGELAATRVRLRLTLAALAALAGVEVPAPEGADAEWTARAVALALRRPGGEGEIGRRIMELARRLDPDVRCLDDALAVLETRVPPVAQHHGVQPPAAPVVRQGWPRGDALRRARGTPLGEVRRVSSPLVQRRALEGAEAEGPAEVVALLIDLLAMVVRVLEEEGCEAPIDDRDVPCRALRLAIEARDARDARPAAPLPSDPWERGR